MGWLDRLAHRREPEADGIADAERRAAAPLPEVAP
jgi:hypothetical protein